MSSSTDLTRTLACIVPITAFETETLIQVGNEFEYLKSTLSNLINRDEAVNIVVKVRAGAPCFIIYPDINLCLRDRERVLDAIQHELTGIPFTVETFFD